MTKHQRNPNHRGPDRIRAKSLFEDWSLRFPWVLELGKSQTPIFKKRFRTDPIRASVIGISLVLGHWGLVLRLGRWRRRGYRDCAGGILWFWKKDCKQYRNPRSPEWQPGRDPD